MDTKKLTYIYIYIYTLISQNNWHDPFPRPPTPPPKKKRERKVEKKNFLTAKRKSNRSLFALFTFSSLPCRHFSPRGEGTRDTPLRMSTGEATPFPPPTPKLRPLFAPTGRLPFRRANSVTTPLISTSLCLPSVHAELQESSISRLSQTPLQRFLQSADKIIKDEGRQRHQYNPKSLSSSRFNGKNAFEIK